MRMASRDAARPFTVEPASILQRGDRILFEPFVRIPIELQCVSFGIPMIDSNRVLTVVDVIKRRIAYVASGGSRLHEFIDEPARLWKNPIGRNASVRKRVSR